MYGNSFQIGCQLSCATPELVRESDPNVRRIAITKKKTAEAVLISLSLMSD